MSSNCLQLADGTEALNPEISSESVRGGYVIHIGINVKSDLGFLYFRHADVPHQEINQDKILRVGIGPGIALLDDLDCRWGYAVCRHTHR